MLNIKKAIKEAFWEKEMCERCTELLENKKWIKDGDWNSREILYLNKFYFLTSKQVIYLVNCSKSDYLKKQNKWLPPISKFIEERLGGGKVIPYSATYELEVSKG